MLVLIHTYLRDNSCHTKILRNLLFIKYFYYPGMGLIVTGCLFLTISFSRMVNSLRKHFFKKRGEREDSYELPTTLIKPPAVTDTESSKQE